MGRYGCGRASGDLAEYPKMDEMDISSEDLAIDEVRELLLEAGANISIGQAEQLARFVAQSSNVENALSALQQLAQQRRAA